MPIQGILIRNPNDTINNTFAFDETESVEAVVVRALRAYYLRPIKSVEITSLENNGDLKASFRAVILCANQEVLHETGGAYLTSYFYRDYQTRALRLHVGMTVYLDETVADQETQVYTLPKPTKTLDLSQVGPAPKDQGEEVSIP